MAGIGMTAGVGLSLAAVRAFASVRRHGKDLALLNLPFGLRLEVRWERIPDGLNLHEAVEVLEKIQRLNRLLDFSVALDYARQYRVGYIGLKGSAGNSWNPGCLACSSLDWAPPGGYRIYLNPELPLPEIAARLSQELGQEIRPEEVQLFLFLHEIGHTRQAGNVCFISAAISSALSGGRRTHRRRKELQKLKVQVEKFADDFALPELLKWRVAQEVKRQNQGAWKPGI
jgi:hypothetical protein